MYMSRLIVPMKVDYAVLSLITMDFGGNVIVQIIPRQIMVPVMVWVFFQEEVTLIGELMVLLE